MGFTIVDRIRQVMEHVELSPSFFADEIGVQRSSVSHILSGRNKPSLDMVTRLLARFPEINPVWMITGNGEMVQLNLFEESPALPERKPGIKPTPPKKVAPPMQREPIVVEPIEPVEDKDVHTLPMFPEEEEQVAPAPVSAPVAETQPEPVPAPVQSIASPAPAAVPQPAIPVQALATPGKKIQKIIIFYDDKTFSVYEQEV